MKKGKLKKLLRDAFIAGGRYYIKGHIPVKIGKTQDFDRWYSENVVNNLDIPVVSVPKGTLLCRCGLPKGNAPSCMSTNCDSLLP